MQHLCSQSDKPMTEGQKSLRNQKIKARLFLIAGRCSWTLFVRLAVLTQRHSVRGDFFELRNPAVKFPQDCKLFMCNALAFASISARRALTAV